MHLCKPRFQKYEKMAAGPIAERNQGKYVFIMVIIALKVAKSVMLLDTFEAI